MSQASTELSEAQRNDELEPELARWLVEAGRRKRPPRDRGPVLACPERPAPRREGRCLPRLLLLGVLATAAFQYIYLDALLQIVSLRSVIVFILARAHG